MLTKQLTANPNLDQLKNPGQDFKKSYQAGDHLARQ